MPDCYERAAETSEKAVHALDRDLKAEYLDMERRWTRLAHSYESVHRRFDLPSCVRSA